MFPINCIIHGTCPKVVMYQISRQVATGTLNSSTYIKRLKNMPVLRSLSGHSLPIGTLPFRPLPSRSLSQVVPGAKRVKKEVRPEEHVNVGTIGHVDHGKTTLTSAITKVCSERKYGGTEFMSYDSIDKAPEEQVRGVTINATHVGYSTQKRHYAHTDCPGHADYIKNMICGTSQMDAAILVVAGSEGAMPQTKEHVMVGQQIGLREMIVYVNKCDLVDDEMRQLTEMEIRELLSAHGFNPHSPFIFGSALAALNGDPTDLGQGSILTLLDALDALKLPQRDLTGPFYMPVDSKVAIPGRGTVIVGTVRRGRLRRMDGVEVCGRGEMISTTAIDIQVFKQSVEQCVAGDHVGILCRKLKKDQIKRGMLLTAPGSVQLNNRYEAKVYMLTKEEGGKSKAISTKYIQAMFSETWTVGARIDVPRDQGGLLMPGDHGTVHVTLTMPMAMTVDQHFTIRDNNRTVISGVITKILPAIDTRTYNNFSKIKFPEEFVYGPPPGSEIDGS